MATNYIPKSDHERHQMYIDAFRHSKSSTELLAFIGQFLTDPSISPGNEDDRQLFNDLLFESKFGKLHISYHYRLLCKLQKGKGKNKRERIAKRIARYCDFLIYQSELFLHDMFDYILRNYSSLTPYLLEELKGRSKIVFIQVASDHPAAVKAHPKLKFYMTFS